MNDTPSLLAALRDAIGAAPVAELPGIAGAVAGLHAEVLARLVAARDDRPEQGPEDELLTPAQAAKVLNTNERWVRDHRKDLPRVQLPGRKLRFSAKRIAAMVKRRSYAQG